MGRTLMIGVVISLGVACGGDDIEATPAGVVLDLSRIEDAKMSDADRGLYEGALQAFPPLRKKNVYVGVETRPIRKDGVLQLGKTAKLRVGSIRYDLGSAARKLGMTEAGLRKALNEHMRRLGFKAPR